MNEKKKTGDYRGQQRQPGMDMFVRRSTPNTTRAHQAPLPQPAARQTPAERNLPVPPVSQKPRRKMKSFLPKLRWPRNKRALLTVVILVSVLLFAGVWTFTRDKSRAENVATQNDTTTTDGTINYQTMLPAGKSIDDLGGWQRVSPPEGDPVFAYTDSIDGISISVSQQPLPKSLKGDVDGWVADLAKKFNATTRIAADDISVYVGTSAKGPQSAIFTKDNLLILIKSETKIEDQSWATYARSLD